MTLSSNDDWLGTQRAELPLKTYLKIMRKYLKMRHTIKKMHAERYPNAGAVSLPTPLGNDGTELFCLDRGLSPHISWKLLSSV